MGRPGGPASPWPPWRGIDAVCHQAAMVGLGVDFADVAAYVHHNDVATAALLGALHPSASRAGSSWPAAWWSTAKAATGAPNMVRCDPAPGQRLGSPPVGTRCHAPSAATTWTGTWSPSPRRSTPATSTPRPRCTRSTCVHAFEREHPGTSAIALRYHNVYGPGMPQDTPYAGVASIFRSAIEHGERPRVFEDGGQRRDFVHVHDVARANVLALRPRHGCPWRIQRGERPTAHPPRDGHRARIADRVRPRRRGRLPARRRPTRRRLPRSCRQRAGVQGRDRLRRRHEGVRAPRPFVPSSLSDGRSRLIDPTGRYGTRSGCGMAGMVRRPGWRWRWRRGWGGRWSPGRPRGRGGARRVRRPRSRPRRTTWRTRRSRG